jgi:hypothetical protein
MVLHTPPITKTFTWDDCLMRLKGETVRLVGIVIILFIPLLLLLTVIEGVRVVWAYVVVQNAAREAARYAVTGQPYDDWGNPWMFPPDRIPGCDPYLDDTGQIRYSPDLITGGDCAGPNDRVDAITGVALESGRGLGVDRYAIHPDVNVATGWDDAGGTYGVRVWGQKSISGPEVDPVVDFAGNYGLNVWVLVYYNVEILDPLYAAIIPDGYVHVRSTAQMQNE